MSLVSENVIRVSSSQFWAVDAFSKALIVYPYLEEGSIEEAIFENDANSE